MELHNATRVDKRDFITLPSTFIVVVFVIIIIIQNFFQSHRFLQVAEVDFM